MYESLDPNEPGINKDITLCQSRDYVPFSYVSRNTNYKKRP